VGVLGLWIVLGLTMTHRSRRHQAIGKYFYQLSPDASSRSRVGIPIPRGGYRGYVGVFFSWLGPTHGSGQYPIHPASLSF